MGPEGMPDTKMDRQTDHRSQHQLNLSCLRDFGGANFFPSIYLPKLTRIFQILSNVTIRKDVQVHRHPLQTITEQLYGGIFVSSRKIVSLFGNNVRIIGCP
jgi:hypothetical protein